jgi:hypothetical protein
MTFSTCSNSNKKKTEVVRFLTWQNNGANSRVLQVLQSG